MRIRSIHPGELEAFAAAGATEHAAAISQYLDQMLAKGAMRAGWCFVAEEKDRFVGRVAYWTLPTIGVPLDIVLLDVPWDGDYLTIGLRLLQESRQALGAAELGYVLDMPPQWPQWHYFPEQRHHLLAEAGFIVERETSRFEKNASESFSPDPQRLTFRPLTEVGEAIFLEAIERVSASSLDQRTQQERARLGPTQEARQTLADLQGMEYDPAWWQLAYTAAGEMAGLIMPTLSPTYATIGYIGIVPEQRGNGYIDDLLRRATAILFTAGATIIRTDTDIANQPMANAFRRAGYAHFATRREYRLRLAS